MSEMLQDIQVDFFLPDLKGATQKQVLQALVKHAAPLASVMPGELLQGLEEKDKTSTFAIGDGIALPNLQMRFLPKPFKALCALQTPVDFGAADGRHIELVCLVLSPEHEGPLHLRRLARISRLLKSPDLRRGLRMANDARAMQSLLTVPQSTMLAA